MMEFGKALRSAREAKGLTTNQIAESTKLMVQVVEDLECERFERIPAPIYGRGFVKLYCEAVGVDPRPLIDEFMAIYSGNREPVIRERAVKAPPPSHPLPARPAPPPETESAVHPEPTPDPDSLFAPARDTMPARPSSFLGIGETKDAPKKLRMPAVPWRLVLLIAAVCALLWLAVSAFSALFRSDAANSATPTPAVTEEAVQPPDRGQPAATREPRAFIDTAPLYLD